jgi:hypothetical protein
MDVAPKVMSCKGTIMFRVTSLFDPRRIVFFCEGFVISYPFCGFLRMISLVSMTVSLVTLVCRGGCFTGGLMKPAVKPVSCV